MTKQSDEAIRELARRWGWDYSDDIPRDNRNIFLSDLTALIEEHYYPKDFIKWKDTRYHCVAGLYLEKQPEGSDKTFRQIPHFTLDELYQYWKENEQ